MTGAQHGKRETTPARPPSTSRLLAVGELFPPDLLGAAAAGNDITYLAFEEVTGEVIDRLAPDIVLSPLVCPAFDCFDLAEILASRRFTGRYRAVARALPRPALVRREIAELYPDLDFDLLLLDLEG